MSEVSANTVKQLLHSIHQLTVLFYDKLWNYIDNEKNAGLKNHNCYKCGKLQRAESYVRDHLVDEKTMNNHRYHITRCKYKAFRSQPAVKPDCLNRRHYFD